MMARRGRAGRKTSCFRINAPSWCSRAKIRHAPGRKKKARSVAAAKRQPLRMALTLDPEDTRGRIHDLVWCGFYPDADVEWMITDEYLDPDELTAEDRAWVKAEAESACAAKRAAEAGWPAQTEYERLEAVF
eukprot:gene60806-83165_t